MCDAHCACVYVCVCFILEHISIDNIFIWQIEIYIYIHKKKLSIVILTNFRLLFVVNMNNIIFL